MIHRPVFESPHATFGVASAGSVSQNNKTLSRILSFEEASHILVILSEDEPEGRDGSRGIFALPWKGQFRGFWFIKIKNLK